MTSPLVINDVEVITINPLLRYFAVIVHLRDLPEQMNVTDTNNLMRNKLRSAINYMMAEGFLPNIVQENWLIDITSVCHPPSNNYGQTSSS